MNNITKEDNIFEDKEVEFKKIEDIRFEKLEYIGNILESVKKQLKAAEGVADEYGLDFRFDFGCYGSGSWYTGRGKGDFKAEITSFNFGWLSSSQSC